MKRIGLVVGFLFLSGCSNPFGSGSLIDGIASTVDNIFGKTSTEFVSGGANKFQTSSSYTGSVSVGNYINQDQQVTNGGYRVITTIK